MSGNEIVTVRVLDREYSVGCPPEEREGLLAAARTLDQRMREIRGNNRMAAIDRLAVLAALNLAHELQQQRSEGASSDELDQRLSELEGKLTGFDNGEPGLF